MDKLWSPWRSKYIESFKDKTGDEECIFCASAKATIEDDNHLVCYRGEFCFIMLNLYPYNNGHLMVVPFKHISDFSDLSIDERLEIMRLIDKSTKCLTGLMKPHGFNVGANLGKAAGAGIDQHLHFHVVPRWSGDTNFMPVLGDVKVISQDLSIAKKQLIDAFKKLN